LIWRGTISQVS